LVFEAKDVLARVQKMGDLFEPVLQLKQKLPPLAGLAGGREEEKVTSIAAQAETPPHSKPRSKAKATKTGARKRRMSAGEGDRIR
jgi:hypothetical protein